MMRIAVNTLPELTPAATPWESSLLQYIRAVLGAMRGLDQKIQFVLLTSPWNHEFFDGFDRVLTPGAGGYRLVGRSPLEKAVLHAKVDAVLSPVSQPLALSLPQYLVATEVLPWVLPGEKKRPARPSRHLLRALRRARAVISPSHALQRQLAEVFEIGLDKIVVAPPGIMPAADAAQASIIEGGYALLPVNPHTLPAVPALLEVYAKRPELLPPTLVVLGAPWRGEPAQWGVNTVRIERCPAGVASTLVRHAALLLYPALHDGACLPVLEALHAGTSVLAAKSGAAEEWGGKNLLYCEADNAASMLQTLRRFHEETETARAERRHAGKSLVAEHDWQRCAWKWLSAFNRVE